MIRIAAVLLAVNRAFSQIPTCTVDESLISTGGSLACAAVDCSDKYGPARSYFNPATRLCSSPPTSPSPSAAATRLPGTSASPRVSSSRSTATNGTSGGTSQITCVHGTVVCGAATCACRCEDGWQTTTGSTGVASSGESPSSGGQGISGTVWCNQSSTGLITVGQIAAVPCYNSVQCFFVDQLPYALVSQPEA